MGDPVIVDSNVLLDVITDDPAWGAWSSRALERVAGEAIVVINALIYAEVSAGFASVEAPEEALPAALFRREHLPYEAAFLAGKAFLRHRKAGGTGVHRCRTSTWAHMPRSLATGS